MSTDPTRRRPRTPTDEEMPSLLEALAAAGGNTAAFARERGLAAWKLYEAQRVALGAGPRRRGRQGRRDFVPVQVVEQAIASAAPFELVLGADSQRLLIPCGFDGPTLRRLLEVLASC